MSAQKVIKRSSGDDDASNNQPASFKLLGLTCALIVSALPGFLFTTINAPMYASVADMYLPVGACTAVAFIALYLSYGNMYSDSIHHLTYLRKKVDTQTQVNLKRVNMSSNEVELMKQSNSRTEAAAWTFFCVNSIFTISYFFIFKYVLQALLDWTTQYAVSMGVAAVGTWYLTSLKYSSA